MKRNLSLFFTWTFFLTAPVMGQDDLAINRSLQDFASRMRFSNNNAGIGNASASNSSVEGSEYLDNNFVKGDLITQNSELFSGIPMRYNAYYENFEVKLPDSMIYSLSDPGLIFQVRFQKETMIYTRYVSPLGEREGFLFVLYEGKCALYRRNYKVFKERIPSNGILNEVPAKLVDKPKEFYIRTKEGPPAVIPSKKELLFFLGDHSDEMEKYIKKEKTKLNNGEDLIRLLTYYDSL
jgi:hypothetical protein